MYVKVTIPQKRLQQIFQEDFKTRNEAINFINISIKRQYEFCVKAWGLCTYSAEVLGDITTVIFRPVIKLIKPLKVIFQIN